MTNREQQTMSVTKVFKNPAVCALRAFVLNELDRIKWRHHGIGVLQGYIVEGREPEVRVHIWSRELLKLGMDLSGDIHDHRFDMVSHVLHGNILHEEIDPTGDPDGTHCMMGLTHARAAAESQYHGPTHKLLGRFIIKRNLIRIEAGMSYRFPALHFHRSPVDGLDDEVVVTVIEKHRQVNMHARLLYPIANEPVMAFGHDIDAAVVIDIIEKARRALATE